LHCFLQNMDHPRPDDPVDKKTEPLIYRECVLRLLTFLNITFLCIALASILDYSMNNELTESSLLILNIVSANKLATLN
jgi:hypothetical protein